MNITNFHLRPFELMIEHFEVSQKQNNGQKKKQIKMEICIKLTLKLIEALFI